MWVGMRKRRKDSVTHWQVRVGTWTQERGRKEEDKGHKTWTRDRLGLGLV
jgi:hypothetical protein